MIEPPFEFRGARHVDLEKLTFALRVMATDEGLAGVDWEVDSWRCPEIHAAVVELKATVLGQRRTVAVVQWPATWWDAVKERFRPRWLRRWFPVWYKEQRVEAYALLPTFDLKIPGHRTTIVIEKHPAAIRARGNGHEAP